MQSPSPRVRCSLSPSAFLAALTLASGSIPAASVRAQAARVPTPESVLGYRVGADRKLADWGEITGYFARLAAATASDPVCDSGSPAGLPWSER